MRTLQYSFNFIFSQKKRYLSDAKDFVTVKAIDRYLSADQARKTCATRYIRLNANGAHFENTNRLFVAKKNNNTSNFY